MADKIFENDVSDEEYREYDLGDRVYRIDAPVRLFIREGGSTHRVLDANGIVHLAPGPGVRGTVIRWKPRRADKPVAF